MESKVNPEDGTESHLNSSFCSAAAISRLASSGSVFLRFFKQYLNYSKRPTDFLPAPSPLPLPFRANAADRRFKSALSQAGATLREVWRDERMIYSAGIPRSANEPAVGVSLDAAKKLVKLHYHSLTTSDSVFDSLSYIIVYHGLQEVDCGLT
eukprot:1677263-Pleurochrysis_carterae.AAC.1